MPDYGNYGGTVESRRIPSRDEPKMEADPPLWKKILRAQSGELGMDPMVGGLSMKFPGNAAKVTDMMKAFLPEGREATVAERGIAYLKAKYPTLSSLAVGGMHDTPRAELPSMSNGLYSPATKSVHLPNSSPLGLGRSNGDLVETGGHELTHALQDYKGWKGPKGRPFHPIEVHGDDGAVTLRPSDYEAETSRVGYWDNPYEVNARQGGDTALNTYNKYSDHTRRQDLGTLASRVKAGLPPDLWLKAMQFLGPK